MFFDFMHDVITFIAHTDARSEGRVEVRIVVEEKESSLSRHSKQSGSLLHNGNSRNNHAVSPCVK